MAPFRPKEKLDFSVQRRDLGFCLLPYAGGHYWRTPLHDLLAAANLPFQTMESV